MPRLATTFRWMTVRGWHGSDAEPGAAGGGLMGVRGTGIAIAIAGSAILHAVLLTVLDAVDTPEVVEPLPLPRLTMERRARPTPPIDDAIPIQLVVLAGPYNEIRSMITGKYRVPRDPIPLVDPVIEPAGEPA